MSGLAALWLVRHAQSEGNVARERAESAGAEVIELADRDADVPLSELGQEQAAALGRHLADLPPAQRPTVVLTSPYLRAFDTARTVVAAARATGPDLPLHVDERLRDRELGILDLLTVHGVQVRHPEEAARKRHLGKFYHRPPGGESWADVALRLRATYGDAARELAGDRVLVVTHEAPILLTRYLLDRLSERDLLDLGRRTALGNGAITSYERVPGGDLRLTSFNDSAYLHRHGAPSTAEPEVHGNAD